LFGSRKSVRAAGNFQGMSAKRRPSGEVQRSSTQQNVERLSVGGLDKGALVARRGPGHEEDWKQAYDVLETLGKGSFGSVMKISHKATKVVRVCKTVDTGKLKPEEITACLLEIKALQRLDHPHIVRLYEHSFDRKNKKLYLILEALGGGDCKQLVKKPYVEVDEEFVSKIIRHTLMATSYCHSMGVVHRDMKPENIMMTTPDRATCVAKVIDFGLSAMFDAGRAHIIRQVAGTVHFMAPEVISRQPFGDPADCWAVGAAMYQFLCGLVPFDGRDVNSCRQAICKNSVKFPPRIGWTKRSKESRDLIRQLLHKDANKRLSAAAALEHPWVLRFDTERKAMTKRQKKVSVGGLHSFKEAPDFIKATLLLTAAQLSPSDLSEIERMFAALDLDRDGFITAEELREVLQEPHADTPKGEEGSMSMFTHDMFSHMAGPEGSVCVQEIVDMADLNGNGVIDFSEFVAACLHARLMKSKGANSPQDGVREILHHAFECFDANRDGQVTQEEMMKVLDTPNIKRIEEQMGVDYKDALRDLPDNFSLNFEEFLETVMSNIADANGGLKSWERDTVRKPTHLLPDCTSEIDENEEFEHGPLDDGEAFFDQTGTAGEDGEARQPTTAGSAQKKPAATESKGGPQLQERQSKGCCSVM